MKNKKTLVTFTKLIKINLYVHIVKLLSIQLFVALLIRVSSFHKTNKSIIIIIIIKKSLASDIL